jgi:membrane-associated phospholipid phosphatase
MTDPGGTGPDRGPRALDEEPQQDYVGCRDLAHWPTAAGRAAAGAALRAARRVAPHRLLTLTLLVGLVLVSALTALAAAVYDAVAESDGVAGLDQPALEVAVSSRSATTNALVTAFTNLGGTIGMALLATAVAVVLALAWRQWTPVLLVAATAAGSITLTVIGKTVVGRTRPPLTEAVPPFEHSHSFPSGHALNSVAIAGIVAYLLLRRLQRAWARVLTLAASTAFAVAMGLSRVYLGHHWLTDVLVAWALGLAWLATVVTAHRLFITVRRRRGPRQVSVATSS